MDDKPRGSFWTKLERFYWGAASLTFNTLVLLFIANAVIGVALFVRDEVQDADDRLSTYRERFADLDAYAVISREEANAFLDEQDAKGTLGFQFDPWRQFREPTYRGQLLNTDEHGFRLSTQPRYVAGEAIDVFVFGGSTTFGYGVPDNHTIPSYLQVALEELHPDRSFRIRNLGQGYYYSSQELALLEQLIRDGDVPEFAVFIDGGNDVAQLSQMRNQPHFSPELQQMWDSRTQPDASPLPDLSWIPMVRLALGMARRAGLLTDSQQPSRPMDTSDALLAARVDYVTSQYLTNVRLRRGICREYEIRCLFVWQPHVVYKYDRSLHRTFPFEGPIPLHYSAIWARMEQMTDPDFLFLGAMFEDMNEKVFVDDVHYNEVTNQRIADRLAVALAVDSPISSVPAP